MKKTMKRMLAALLAGTCLPLTGVTANADDLTNHFGTAHWDAFREMTLMGQGMTPFGTAELYLREDPAGDNLVLVSPRETWLRIVLREDIDPAWGAAQVTEALRTYFPDIYYGADGYLPDASSEYWLEEPGQIEVHLMQTKRPENAEELEAAILLELARKQLISGFYGFGETASYEIGFFGGLKNYPLNRAVSTDTPGHYETVKIDWDGVQDYLSEQNPDFTLEFKGASGDSVSIAGTEQLSEAEQIALACELWEKFEIMPQVWTEPAAENAALGHNSLENKGDVTLDLELDIMDVIAMNKYLVGASTLCDTAKKNADISGDGTPDTTDSLDIMKEIVGLTKDFHTISI